MRSTSNASSGPRSRPVFVFDADFPQGIAQQVLDECTPSIDLISWTRILRSVEGVSDEDFIVNAWQKKCHGVVTCNHFMLDVPETLAIIRQARMTIVACHGKTNKTQFATGVLLVNLEDIARNFVPDRPQVWELKEAMRSPKKFEEHVRHVESNCHCDIRQTNAAPPIWRRRSSLGRKRFCWEATSCLEGRPRGSVRAAGLTAIDARCVAATVETDECAWGRSSRRVAGWTRQVNWRHWRKPATA